jgi:hypothetical protein
LLRRLRFFTMTIGSSISSEYTITYVVATETTAPPVAICGRLVELALTDGCAGVQMAFQMG